ncbi:replication-relaxation family protein [Micromonospora aurantiaca (nom. illeg.)]|uniref:replication-relaxation family protein n=1 Tax=Micromonospora aurantiaca (nom. illeg.) TaxID=47850 RepID=UPI0033EFAFD1
MSSATDWADRYLAGQQPLTAVDVDVLTACLQHRLLTTAHLHAMLCPARTPRWMREVIQRLALAGLLEHVPARGPSGNRGRRRRAWFTTDAGWEVAAPALAPRAYRMTRERAGNAVQRHTLVGSDIAAAFVGGARARGHVCGPLDIDREVAHRFPRGSSTRTIVTADLRVRCWIQDPDGDLMITRLVEVDRAQYGPLQLHAKMRAYGRLYTQNAPQRPGVAWWSEQYQAWPKVLIVLADRPAHLLARRAEALLDLCLADRSLSPHLHELGVWCTTLDQLRDQGPYAAIWQTAAGGGLVDLLGQPG